MRPPGCGCAGCFSSFGALELYAEAFEKAGMLRRVWNETRRLPCSRPPPHQLAQWLPRLRPLPRSPERGLSSLEAWRGLRSSPQLAPPLRSSPRSTTRLHRLEAFCSLNGPAFYGVEPNPGRVTLRRAEWSVPDQIPFGDSVVVPFRAGTTLSWRLQDRFPA